MGLWKNHIGLGNSLLYSGIFSDKEHISREEVFGNVRDILERCKDDLLPITIDIDYEGKSVRTVISIEDQANNRGIAIFVRAARDVGYI
jgi:hypothetical protein